MIISINELDMYYLAHFYYQYLRHLILQPILGFWSL